MIGIAAAPGGAATLFFRREKVLVSTAPIILVALQHAYHRVYSTDECTVIGWLIVQYRDKWSEGKIACYDLYRVNAAAPEAFQACFTDVVFLVNDNRIQALKGTENSFLFLFDGRHLRGVKDVLYGEHCATGELLLQARCFNNKIDS